MKEKWKCELTITDDQCSYESQRYSPFFSLIYLSALKMGKIYENEWVRESGSLIWVMRTQDISTEEMKEYPRISFKLNWGDDDRKSTKRIRINFERKKVNK